MLFLKTFLLLPVGVCLAGLVYTASYAQTVGHPEAQHKKGMSHFKDEAH